MVALTCRKLSSDSSLVNSVSVVTILNFPDATYFYLLHGVKEHGYALKGIVQPFELGGETRLIPSAVKYWKPGKLKKNLS